MFMTIKHRLLSLAIAAGVTFSMLAGIDTQATSAPNPALMAAVGVAHQV